jgi:glutamate dehydrogenase/leucine dehydrogenase
VWSEEEVSDRLDKILCRAFAETEAITRREKVHMRTAAIILGVQRVAKAMELRGIYP